MLCKNASALERFPLYGAPLHWCYSTTYAQNTLPGQNCSHTYFVIFAIIIIIITMVARVVMKINIGGGEVT